MNKQTNEETVVSMGRYLLSLDIQHASSIAADKLPSDELINTWVEATTTLSQFTHKASICIRFVDKDESQALNNQFRQKDYPTNILSFEYDMGDHIEDSEQSLGDIILCPEIIIEEAKQHNVPSTDHFAHLIIHGVLHLLGFDHINDDDATVMQAKEIEILQHLNIEDPYK